MDRGPSASVWYRRQTDTRVSVGWDPAKKGESCRKMPHLKTMEECLETTGQQNGLRRLIDTLPGLVWTALSDGSSDFLNRGWQQYTGVPIEQGV